MVDTFWSVVIQFLVGPLAVLIVGFFLNRKINDTKQTITNSHPVHLRDDLDGKFSLVFARQDTLIDMVHTVDKKLDKQGAEIDQLYATAADHERRLTGQAAKIRRAGK